MNGNIDILAYTQRPQLDYRLFWRTKGHTARDPMCAPDETAHDEYIHDVVDDRERCDLHELVDEEGTVSWKGL